jgi:uncharacterized protein
MDPTQQTSEDILCSARLEGKSSQIVIEDTSCEFLRDHTNPPKFVIGFAGVGMIGTIMTNELIEQLEMKQIGYVLSEDLPPITLFYDGLLKHPFRIYYQPEYNLVVAVCEIPFNPGSYTDLARTLMDWALKSGISDVICAQGMAVEDLVQMSPAPVYAAAEKEILDKILTHDVQRPPRGLIMGAEAAILNECLNNRLNGAVYLTPANPKVPAPEGAAVILQKLSEVYHFPIKVDHLMSQSMQIKRQLGEIQVQTEKIHQLPPMKRLSNDMYS